MVENNDFVKMEIDGVKFKLREKADFSFLQQYGKVFCVFDQNDSGNISFGIENELKEKYFIKVAGAKTLEAFCQPDEAVKALKHTIRIYQELRCEILIDMITFGTFQNLFFVVFRWSDGECLFDHWNFDFYQSNPKIKSPREKFSDLSEKKKLQVADQILQFMTHVEEKEYIAVDFYDGSLMCDFDRNQLTICDIDFFQRKPVINNIGIEYWGAKRMKAPEEYILGAKINSKTNVFTVGALFFHLFGNYSNKMITKMDKENQFIPLQKEYWELPMQLYDIVLKAVNPFPEKRYETIQSLKEEWLVQCDKLYSC